MAHSTLIERVSSRPPNATRLTGAHNYGALYVHYRARMHSREWLTYLPQNFEAEHDHVPNDPAVSPPVYIYHQ